MLLCVICERNYIVRNTSILEKKTTVSKLVVGCQLKELCVSTPVQTSAKAKIVMLSMLRNVCQ